MHISFLIVYYFGDHSPVVAKASRHKALNITYMLLGSAVDCSNPLLNLYRDCASYYGRFLKLHALGIFSCRVYGWFDAKGIVTHKKIWIANGCCRLLFAFGIRTFDR